MSEHRLTLRDCALLNQHELGRLTGLRLSEEQTAFSGSFGESLAQLNATKAPNPSLCCFSLGEEFIGLVTLKRPPTSPDWVPADAVSLHALMIDVRWQGRGLGKAALALSLQEAMRRWPEASSLVLAVDLENAAALALYRSFGFQDLGPACQGRVGLEQRLQLLPPRG